MTPSTFIAPHLRESVFRDYEGFIRIMVSEWPRETAHSPLMGRAATTFVANFRNALLSARTFNWPTDIDLKKLREMTGQYIVKPEADGLVWVRRKVSAAVAPTITKTSAAPAPSSVVPWRDATQDEISALCTLIHFSRLTGPFHIDGPIGEEFSLSLTSTLNVGIVYDAEAKQTIIT